MAEPLDRLFICYVPALDFAPTVLALLGAQRPATMKGGCLFQLRTAAA